MIIENSGIDESKGMGKEMNIVSEFANQIAMTLLNQSVTLGIGGSSWLILQLPMIREVLCILYKLFSLFISLDKSIKVCIFIGCFVYQLCLKESWDVEKSTKENHWDDISCHPGANISSNGAISVGMGTTHCTVPRHLTLKACY